MRFLVGACLSVLCHVLLPAITLEEIETSEVSSFQHAGSTSEIVCHPDGKHVLSSARDRCVRLWEIESGKLVRRFTVEGCGDMWGIRIINDGKEFLAASSSRQIFRFEVATGKVLTTYRLPGYAYRIALHPDGKHFVGTGSQNHASLWEIATGKKIRGFAGHTADVYTAIILAEGKILITGSDDKTLRRWDLETGECLKTVKGKPSYGDVYTIAASPDESKFAMVSDGGSVHLFDAETMNEIWKTKLGEEGEVVAWSPDGSLIGSTSEDGNLYLLSPKDGKILKKIDVANSPHTPITFSNDSKMIISGGDMILHLHDVATGERIEPTMGLPGKIGGYQHIAVGVAASRVYLSSGTKWEVRDRNDETQNRSFNEKSEVSAMALSRDGGLLAIACERGAISVRDTTNFELVGSMSSGASVNALAFLPGGKQFISAGDRNFVFLWSVAGGKRIRSFEGHSDDVFSATLSSDGDQLITASKDKTVRVWAVSSGEEQAKYLIKEGRLSDVILLEEGRSVIVSTNSTKVWGRILPKLEVKEEIDEELVRKLLRELASEEFAQRESAMKELAKFGKLIIPVVEAMDSDDPEVRARLIGVGDVVRGDLAKSGLKEIALLENTLSAMTADPLGQFWVGRMGDGGASQIAVGLIDQEKKSVQVVQTLDNSHGCDGLTFSPDGSHVGTVNADGSYSLFAVKRD